MYVAGNKNEHDEKGYKIIRMIMAEDDSELCKSRRRTEMIIDGEPVEEPQIVLETICRSRVIRENKPINLKNYNTFLKLEGSYWEVLPKEKIERIYSGTFSLLPNLTSLVISQVDLEVLEPHSFKGLENLLYLNLYRNQLKCLPEGLFDDTPNLIHLNIEDNKIEDISIHTFEKLTKLKYLKFALNKLSDLPKNWCSSLRNLQRLELTTNNIKTIKREIFLSLGELRELDLGVNGIEVIEKDAFKGLNKLEKLSLIYNGHIAADLAHEINNLPALKTISLCSGNFDKAVYKEAAAILEKRKIEVSNMGH